MLTLGPPAAAHRLDEHLQATLIGMAAGGMTIEIQLTPGAVVFTELVSLIDRNGDGELTALAQSQDAARVIRDLDLRVDGVTAQLTLAYSEFPAWKKCGKAPAPFA